MATRWRKPLAAWQETFRGWVEAPEPQALIEAEVFLDFRKVHGDLSTEPLERLLLAGAERRLFLVQLARAATRFGPPLSLFGRIRADADPERRAPLARLGRARGDGRDVDLKRGGIAAVVLLGRLYALAARSSARPTLERLEAAAAARTLSRGRAEGLADAFRLLMRLRLREQLRRVAAGGTADNRVALDDLSPLEQRRLWDAFRVIQEQQRAAAQTFQTEATGGGP